jgi:hypothetical protein
VTCAASLASAWRRTPPTALARAASSRFSRPALQDRTVTAAPAPGSPADPPPGPRPGSGHSHQLAAEPDGQQRRSGPIWDGAAREFIPGNYCRLCGYPFPASRRRTPCGAPVACQRRQQLPLQLRAYGCPHDDRVHPEWRDLHS